MAAAQQVIVGLAASGDFKDQTPPTRWVIGTKVWLTTSDNQRVQCTVVHEEGSEDYRLFTLETPHGGKIPWHVHGYEL